MIVGLLLLLFLPALALADETVAPKTVLVLYEETRALAAVAETDDAIRSTLQAGSTPPSASFSSPPAADVANMRRAACAFAAIAVSGWVISCASDAESSAHGRDALRVLQS